MNKRTRALIEQFVRGNIDSFHQERVKRLQQLRLKKILAAKNPYLFRAKNLNRAAELVNAILDALLSSSEEGCFGGFLENLAIYVAEQTGGGHKSAAEGIDIELMRGKVRHLIAVKSGRNWGNADQQRQLKRHFKTAKQVIRQGDKKTQLQATLGICYGRFKTKDNGEYLHIGGQSFWHLISGDANLYVDIVEPLGHRAEEHNIAFNVAKDNIANRLTLEFMQEYCDQTTGAINWPKLVRFVCGNMAAR